MLNKSIIMGRLVADPEIRTTQNGISVASLRVAVDRDYTPKGEERQTDFINVTAWRQTAEFISRYFSKGRMIVVEGRLQVRNYEDKSGNKRTAYEIVADNVYFGDAKSESGSTQAKKTVALTVDDLEDFEDVDDDEMPF